MNAAPKQNPGLGSPDSHEELVTNESIASKIREMDDEELLRWIQQKIPKLLRDQVLLNFKDQYITGDIFLDQAGNAKFFEEKCNLPTGPSYGLAKLASEVLEKETRGIKRHNEQVESSGNSAKIRRQDSNQKRLPLSRLEGSDVIYETKSSADHSRPIFPTDAAFSSFFTEHSTIIADKTHFIPLLEMNDFQYMFLRPRRWGKSTFLNMLAAYYDVATKDSFEEIFGELHIGRAPTKTHNSHLILLFNFSTIVTHGPLETVKRSVFQTISMSLNRFLLKYQDILGNAVPGEYIVPGEIATSLTNVLDLVDRSGHTVFVGVDEYDRPANTCLMCALQDRTSLVDMRQRFGWLEEILQAEFFAVIKPLCGDTVAKYWLTGVLPAFRDGISPLTAVEVISFDKKYQSLCGLTEEDVGAIVTRALPGPVSTMASLKLWYNGYMFRPPRGHSENLTLYNPQHVFVHLRKAISGTASPFYADEANAIHTNVVLSAIGETGPVTIHDLTGMLYSDENANILSELSFAELTQDPQTRSRDVTWSFLFYLGVVTFSKNSIPQSRIHTLRLPNASMIHLISQRINGYLNSNPGFSTKMRTSYTDFMSGNFTPLVQLLESFFYLLSTRSLVDSTELSLENVIKLLWFDQQCATQLHLVMDQNKRWGDGQNGFTDIFCGESPRIHVIELKNVSLRGLWKARNPNGNSPSHSDFGTLIGELEKATEEDLLNMEYCFYDKAGQRLVTERVKDILEAATTQLNCYISAISLGQGEKAGQGNSARSGVVDARVWCKDGGHDVLWGYCIICVGTRIICRQTARRATTYSYEFTYADHL